MAFSVEIQSCPTRPQNNSTNSNSHNQNSADTTIVKRDNSCRKSPGNNIDDPGTIINYSITNTTSRSTEAKSPDRISNRLRRSSVSNDTSTNELAFDYPEDFVNSHSGTRDTNTEHSKNTTKTHYKSTLFTKAGTLTAFSETKFADRERLSKKLKPKYGIARFERYPREFRSFERKYFDQYALLQLRTDREQKLSSNNYIRELLSNKPYRPKEEYQADLNTGINGWDSVDRVRRIPYGNEWSNAAYCYS